MRYLYLVILSLLTTALSAQYIYVSSDRDTYGGWVVSPEGETIYTIPDGWRPAAYNGPMAEITVWPLLLERLDTDEKLHYAFVTQKMEWQIIEGYSFMTALANNRFRGLLAGNKYFVLLDEEARQVCQDSFRDIRRYFQEEVAAIACVEASQAEFKYGLIDTMGQWLVPPSFKKLHYMKQDRYLAYDSLDNQYLLTPQFDSGQWDTLAVFAPDEGKLSYLWSFDHTGHSWLDLKGRSYRILNKQGQFVGDTVFASGVRSFVDGIAAIQGRKTWSYINSEGQLLSGNSYTAANDFSDEYALAADTVNSYLGYLNTKGEWALEPAYCYASSFRNNCAVVAPAIPANCSTRVRGRGGDLHIPPTLKHTRRILAYQLIDTAGRVILADSCLGFYLPAEGVVGVNYTYFRNGSAIMLKWLKENRIWINPDFTVYRWSQLDSLQSYPIKKINLGIRRFDQLYDETFELPVDFVAYLSKENRQYLEELNVESHQLNTASLEAIFRLPRLRKLALGYNDLSALPESIRRLKQLEELDLSGTPLTSLPRAVYRMKHLKKLFIINTDLPAETIPRLRKALPNTEIIFKYE